MTVGERVKSRRKELNISADDLAEAIGVSRSTIFRYENGEIEKLPVDALKPIADILHTTPYWLIGVEEMPAANEGSELILSDEDKAVVDRVIKLSYENKLKMIGYLDSLTSKDNQ